MTVTLARTPLHDWHAKQGAKLVDFAGWSMPVYYESIVAEHLATRHCVGLFDISHMGRFRFAGREAVRSLEGLLTRRVENLEPGRVRYSLITNTQGGILDDVLVSHLRTGNESVYWLVVNAGNRDKLLRWITPRVAAHDTRFSDETLGTAMIAVQGPRALEIVDAMFSHGKPSQLEYYTGASGLLEGLPVTVSRTGYTGEDGVELIVPIADVSGVWERLIRAARDVGGRPVGLGARDTLRLEAGMPLYGHELSEAMNPYQAGLGFAVQLSGREFPGRSVLEQRKRDPGPTCRVGLIVEGKRVPREHHTILDGQEQVGEVTSGTFSPSLQKPIAMGYVSRGAADLGRVLSIEIRGRRESAKVVKLPFYRRAG